MGHHYRTLLANERTFLGWQGTSLSLIAAAVGVASFVGTGASVLWSSLAIPLALSGAAASSTGWLRWRRNDRAIRRDARVSICDEEAITKI
jgi:putative membrane protein